MVLSCAYICMQVAAEKRVAEGATRSRTLLFLFLQGTHALEMQRRFLLASSSSALFFPRRPFFAGGGALLAAALVGASASAASISSSTQGIVVVYTVWGLRWRGAL